MRLLKFSHLWRKKYIGRALILNFNSKDKKNRLLIDYCKSRQADSNYMSESNEVTNASFAKFIVDMAECINDIRECDLLPFSTTNHEYVYIRA